MIYDGKDLWKSKSGVKECQSDGWWQWWQRRWRTDKTAKQGGSEKTDQDEADEMKQEDDSTDEVIHIEMSDRCQ